MTSSRRLDVREVGDLPLREVSGLGQRRGGEADSVELVAVGDEQFTVLLATIEDALAGRGFEAVDLGDIIEGVAADDGSEWEAADGDASGRIFVLQESPSRVFVVAPNLDRVEHTIDLHIAAGDRERLNWEASVNARAEGLVLLRNGHLLVAKEKDPPVVMEFGPPGRGHAGGLAPDLVFATPGAFPVPPDDRSQFSLLATWRLDTAASRAIADISDIAAAPDGHVYLLSDESRCIARVEPELAPSAATLSVTAVWSLPDELEQPEGLVVSGDMVPVVAIDKEEPRSNIFVMSPLEDS